MTAPNFANIMEQVAFFAKLLDVIEIFGATATTGYVAREASAIQDLDLDYPAGVSAGLERMRSSLAEPLNPSSSRSTFDYFLLQVAKVINSPSEDPAVIWRDLYDYMYDNAQYVNSREFVFGTPSAAGGNTGNGRMLRITNDDRGMTMEGWFADAFSCECIRDARQIGISYEEEFHFEGGDAAKDGLNRTGTGLDVVLRCSSERDSERYVQNPSFESYGGTTPTAGSETTPTSITGWTVAGALSNTRLSVDYLWRTPPGSSTSVSLKLVASETISQDLVVVNGTSFDPNVPYHVQVAVYRRDSCDGNLIFTLGGTTRTVAMSTLNNGAWNVVDLVASPGSDNWYEGFKANSLSLSIQLSGRTTGSLYLDGLILAPYALVGGSDLEGRGAMGSYVILTAGATPWVLGDKFTFTDTEGATRAVNQFWFASMEYGYLPSTAAAYETVADKA